MEIFLLHNFQWKELKSPFHLLVKQVKPREDELFTPQEMKFMVSVTPHVFVKVSHRGAWGFSVHLPTYRCKKFHLCLLNFPFLLAACPHHLLIMLSQAFGWIISALFCSFQWHWLHHLVIGTTSLKLGPRWEGLASNLLFFLIQNRIFRWVIYTHMTSVRVNIVYRWWGRKILLQNFI